MVGRPSTVYNLDLASIFFGLFLGLFLFTFFEVIRQSWSIWKRTHRLLNIYLIMIWVEALVNLAFAITTYLFLRGVIPPTLAYYTIAVTLWTFQTQLLLQIVANRVGLIMVERRKARILKWSLFIAVALVNISVFCIWIPALMGVSQMHITLNNIWERVEKSFFLVVDLGLNSYFLHLVRKNLIARGLTKYWRLFKINVCLIGLSTCMDILLLGLLSLPNTYAYVQFSPIAYIVKLAIELNNAVLISKVVRTSTERVDGGYSGSNQHSNGVRLTNRNRTDSKPTHSSFGADHKAVVNTCECNDNNWNSCTCDQYNGDGIMKTVTTLMRAEKASTDRTSTSSSERRLKDGAAP